MKWISVKEQLPPPYIFVLVHEMRTHEPSPTSIARWEGDEWNGLGENEDETNAFYSDLFWDISWKNITHWMPLPKGPNKESS